MRLSRRPDPALLALFDEAGQNVRRVGVLLQQMMSVFPEVTGLREEIVACEHEGDRIAHDILHRLAEHGAKRAHMDAADVHALAVALDDIVDYAEEAADQLGRYGVEAPMEQAEAIASVLVATCEQVSESLRDLRDGREIAHRLVEIHRLENEADEIVRAAVASLFAVGIDPMTVIRWKDIYETMESAVDACETVANVLEGISLKRNGGR